MRERVLQRHGHETKLADHDVVNRRGREDRQCVRPFTQRPRRHRERVNERGLLRDERAKTTSVELHLPALLHVALADEKRLLGVVALRVEADLQHPSVRFRPNELLPFGETLRAEVVSLRVEQARLGGRTLRDSEPETHANEQRQKAAKHDERLSAPVNWGNVPLAESLWPRS